MDKKSLRQKAKAERQKLSQEEIEDKSLAIANQLLRMDILDKLYYHLFLTIEEQKEINTEYILQILAGKDKEIVISKCEFETLGMTHFLLTDNTKIKKVLNIQLPISTKEGLLKTIKSFQNKYILIQYDWFPIFLYYWLLSKVFKFRICSLASKKSPSLLKSIYPLTLLA